MPQHRHRFQFFHSALADPLRLRLLEALWSRHPQSAKELARQADVRPDRLYYHLAQLERAGLIEIAEYRPLAGGKVERMYRPTTVEPPGDAATPSDVAHFLNTVLEATQLDIAAAGVAKEAGKRRETHLLRTTLRLSDKAVNTLRERINELVRAMEDDPTDDGVWTRVVVAFVDMEDRDQPDNTRDVTSQ
jgi:DNA-binding transcriptional ArsR family regulator